MRAVVVEGRGGVSVTDLPDPSPGPGEALIRVHTAGICGTDLQFVRGYMGFTGVPGHEFVGTVEAVTSKADSILLGARVTGEINIGCQDCALCAEGLSRHCRARRVVGILDHQGAFAERLALPVCNLHALPDSITDEQAVFVEPLAAAFEILDQIALPAGHRVLVLGDGRLGLLVAQVLAIRGGQVTVAGRHEVKLALAASRGLATTMNPSEAGRPYDLVVEATGSPRGLDEALGCVRPRGTVILKSTCAEPTTFQAWRAVVDEVTLIGSRCGRFGPAIAALAAGEVSVKDLISAVFPLERGREAFERAGQPDTLKVLLRVAA